jgi:cytoskeletal protein RodZ
VKLPFRRTTTTSDNLPTEIKEYYQTERRERVGVAWLLALGTLLLTLILATGLFFGGRWAYRKIAGTDKKPETAQTTSKEEEKAAPAPSATQGSSSEQPGPTGTSSTSTSTPSTTSTPATPPSPTPAPAPSTALPNTGPSEVIGIALATTVAGTAAHSLVWARRKARD